MASPLRRVPSPPRHVDSSTMRRPLRQLLLAAILVGGCMLPRGRADNTLRLPIRFHLLTSFTSTALSTTRTEEDARVLLSTANNVWAQAGIEWYIEGVLREEAPNASTFDSLVAGTAPRTMANLISFVPREHLLDPGWNVFLIRDFGQIAGGMFRPEIAGVVLAERGFGFELPASERGGKTLAH